MKESAFPVNTGFVEQGMTLHDYFIAHAPPMPSGWTFQVAEGEQWVDKHAAWAHKWADAVMARREMERRINSRMV